ncbi:MAG: DUF3108 domain-containing protein [Bryobacteraceae bacterium]|jgi:hypothetical protein
MSKRIVFFCALFGLLLWWKASGSPGQKPADPPSDPKVAATATVAAAKESQPAKNPTAPEAPAFLNGGESLDYALHWPGGASLGEAHLRASKGEHSWQLDFSMSASVPGFTLSDHYHSRANDGFCSLELEKQTTHGQRKTHERTVFNYQEGSATRTTLVDGGGHTDISISDCARDGLDFVYYARRELSLGHGVPPQQDVLFGAAYSVRMAFAGVQDVNVGGKHRQADHCILYIAGPASDYQLDIFFERNAARTPLMIKAPLPLGTLSMELER